MRLQSLAHVRVKPLPRDSAPRPLFCMGKKVAEGLPYCKHLVGLLKRSSGAAPPQTCPKPHRSVRSGAEATMSEAAKIRYQIHPDTAWQEAADEIFVVTADNRLHNLRDAVSVTLWHTLQAGASIDALVDQVVTEFDVSADEALEDIQSFIGDAEERALIQRVS